MAHWMKTKYGCLKKLKGLTTTQQRFRHEEKEISKQNLRLLTKSQSSVDFLVGRSHVPAHNGCYCQAETAGMLAWGLELVPTVGGPDVARTITEI